MTMLRASALFVLLAGAVSAATLDDAYRLYRERNIEGAKAALIEITAAEPQNAQACYLLGLVLGGSKDPKVQDEALVWLEKATKLAPNNAPYLTGYGQQLMAYAAKHTSLSSASKARDALEQALTLNPKDLGARVTLYEYYERAPWPIGSSTKAAAQIEEMKKIDPDRTFTILVGSKTSSKKFAEAFKLCEERLAAKPDDPWALFHYGRVAAVSGQNGDRGIESLQKYIALAPNFKDAPTLANAWGRIGNIEEKRGNKAAARAAYETMLKLEPGNPSAQAALANLDK
jgi:tetratricopeptide (TPR) repeat protein